MRKYIKYIPNMLTFSRIGITILLDCMMMIGFESGRCSSQIGLIIVLTSILYGTDLLDGKLARGLKCSSKFGARMDIFADFLYMVSQDCILLHYKIMSEEILFLVLVEFVVFIASSAKAMKITGVEHVWFDRIGRITAGYYYVMPLIYWMIAQVQDSTSYISLILMADFVCIFLTVAAIGSRLTVVVGIVGNHSYK